GRLLFVHRSSVWLTKAAAWAGVASFAPPGNELHAAGTVVIDQSFPAGTQLAQWLAVAGAGTATGAVPLASAEDSGASAGPSARTWATLDPATSGGHHGAQILTFQTPLAQPAAAQCGRVTFTDVHESNNGSPTETFPSVCLDDANQDFLLTFMVFQLSSCVP